MIALLVTLLQFYLLAFLIRIGLSWFPPPSSGFMVSLTRFLYAITEPVLAPLRAILPPVQVGSMALDLSPTIVIFGLFLLIGVLQS